MTENHLYRNPNQTLEIQELRKLNEKLLKENQKFRKTFAVGDKLRRSWERSEIGLTFIVTSLLAVVFVAAMLPISCAYRQKIVDARATAYAVERFQTLRAEGWCNSTEFPGSDGFDSCLIRRNKDAIELIQVECSENFCQVRSSR
jgi:hypothetical protein